MHTHSLDRWSHPHVFLGASHARNERRVWAVVALTAAMMLGEIVGGTYFGSLAVVADGWHMATHVVALAVAALAYRYARRHAGDARYSFGTGKVGDLAAFGSAVALALVALAIGYESVARLLAPIPIAYGEAIAVASLGLAVNVGSAFLLRDEPHAHGHDPDHHRGHAHDYEAARDERLPPHDHAHSRGPVAVAHADNNLRAAYVHVIADAATSVLAVVGLVVAATFGRAFVDPLVGLAGTAVILRWSYGLSRDAGRVLVDAVPDHALERAVRERLERTGDRITDLHLWRVGPGHYSAIVSIVTHAPQAPAHYKAMLASFERLSHVTVEVETCTASDGAACR